MQPKSSQESRLELTNKEERSLIETLSSEDDGDHELGLDLLMKLDPRERIAFINLLLDTTPELERTLCSEYFKLQIDALREL